MPSTYLSLHHHLVFSTQNRVPMIAEDWQGRLHEYLGGTINQLGGFSQRVGGVANHVHLLVGLKSTHTLADVMRELKKSPSLWVHQEIGQMSFAWQEGYGRSRSVQLDERASSDISPIRQSTIASEPIETN